MRVRSAAAVASSPRPSQSSANTAPASTAANWSLSPSRISRACGGSASSSLAISARSTIDASSTTSTSSGSGLAAWWRTCGRSPRLPSRRCRVRASSGSAAFTASLTGRWALALRSASAMRAAALPVGAARPMARRSPPGCSSSAASRRTTVVVLPVPGPPEITARLRRTAWAAARRCQSGCWVLKANRRARLSARRASSSAGSCSTRASSCAASCAS
ncbi:hypothetical protein D9M69_343790 [compost metagenome]